MILYQLLCGVKEPGLGRCVESPGATSEPVPGLSCLWMVKCRFKMSCGHSYEMWSMGLRHGNLRLQVSVGTGDDGIVFRVLRGTLPDLFLSGLEWKLANP